MRKIFKMLMFLENNAQDGMETTTTGTTEDLSNQGKAHNLKIGKPIREQDRFLPMAKVARLMKKILPVGVMVNKKHITVICCFLMSNMVIDCMYRYIV